MPSRYDVFYNGGIYHIYNKTIDKKQIFSESLCKEFINNFCYYRSQLSSKLRYSLFKKLPKYIYKYRMEEVFYRKHFLIDIIAFSLQANHFHFLLKQLEEKGVIKFMSNISNSLTRYYNVRNNRKGPIFLPQFKSKRVKNQEGLNYVSRYIHTNCFAHTIVKTIDEIFTYPYSSVSSYVTYANKLKINREKVMFSFGNDAEKYRKFIINNAEDQK